MNEQHEDFWFATQSVNFSDLVKERYKVKDQGDKYLTAQECAVCALGAFFSSNRNLAIDYDCFNEVYEEHEKQERGDNSVRFLCQISLIFGGAIATVKTFFKPPAIPKNDKTEKIIESVITTLEYIQKCYHQVDVHDLVKEAQSYRIRKNASNEIDTPISDYKFIVWNSIHLYFLHGALWGRGKDFPIVRMFDDKSVQNETWDLDKNINWDKFWNQTKNKEEE